MWSKLFAILLSAALIWWLFHYHRTHPSDFSKENFRKSFVTMGILALILIGFFVLCLIWLRAS